MKCQCSLIPQIFASYQNRIWRDAPLVTPSDKNGDGERRQIRIEFASKNGKCKKQIITGCISAMIPSFRSVVRTRINASTWRRSTTRCGKIGFHVQVPAWISRNAPKNQALFVVFRSEKVCYVEFLHGSMYFIFVNDNSNIDKYSSLSSKESMSLAPNQTCTL